MAQIIKEAGKKEYKADGMGEVAANLLIGGKDDVVGNKVVPNLNMSWECFSGNEKFWMNINRKNVIVGSEEESFDGNELKLKIGNETDIWKLVGNRLKWNIQFGQQPPGNVFEWELKCSKELQFYRQNTLEDDFLEDPDGEPNLAAYLKHHHRPDDVVGSYSVKCGKANNTPSAKYFTGKICHIYRPLCIDVKGKTEWADLFIDPSQKIFRITIPQIFLDKADYPIILDPNLGYTTVGGTTYSTDTYTRLHREEADCVATEDGFALKVWTWLGSEVGK